MSDRENGKKKGTTINNNSIVITINKNYQQPHPLITNDNPSTRSDNNSIVLKQNSMSLEPIRRSYDRKVQSRRILARDVRNLDTSGSQRSDKPHLTLEQNPLKETITTVFDDNKKAVTHNSRKNISNSRGMGPRRSNSSTRINRSNSKTKIKKPKENGPYNK